jgi:hypothetical protein
MEITGGSFEVVASGFSLLCGAVAMVLLFEMLRRRLSTFASAATVTGLSAFASAPVFQVAYTESLSLLLLVIVLWTLQTRRYWAFSAVVVILSLTRPVVLPLLLVFLVHWFLRWRRDRASLTSHDHFRIGATAGVVALSALLWPLIAWFVTGDRAAFLATQESWSLTPGASMLRASITGRALIDRELYAAVLLIGVVAYLLFVLGPVRARTWPIELRAWALAYPAYILLATQPTASTYRYLLLAIIPFWPFPEPSETRSPRSELVAKTTLLVLFVAVGLYLQYFWVTGIFTVDTAPDEQPFP